jgi:hypothetical protein
VAEIDDKRNEAVEGLSRAISLLEEAEVDQGMQDRGWTSELAALIARTMSENRARIESGWIPPAMSDGYWIRLMMDSVVGDDQVAHSVYEGADAVNQYAKAAESGT